MNRKSRIKVDQKLETINAAAVDDNNDDDDDIVTNEEEEDRKESSVLKTLFLFTSIMFIVPISCYFISKSYLFEGDNKLLHL